MSTTDSYAEARKNALGMHADIGKTLITASGIVMSLVVAFATKNSWTSGRCAALFAIGAALSFLTLCIIAAVRSNNRVLSIGKKLANTKFKSERSNIMSIEKYWDKNIRSATYWSNTSSYMFASGALSLLIAAIITIAAGGSNFQSIFATVEADLVASKKMIAPVSWESVSKDSAKETFTFNLVDAANRRLVCTADLSGNLQACAP